MPQSAHQQVTVVRHGQTEWSAAGRHTGRTDVGLTARGEQDARAAGRWLADTDYSHVWASPLRRAFDTCTLAGFGERAEVVDDLVEWDYGRFEGLTRAEILEQSSGWLVWTHGAPNGESVAALQARVDRIVGRLLETRGQTLLFAHGHLLRALAAAWMELPITEGRRVLLDTGALGTLGWYHERRALVRWNVTPPWSR